MTIELTTDNLLNYLKEQKLNPTFQKESGQIYITMNIADFEVPIFFGVRSESQLLQILAYLPYQLHEKTFGEIARVLHLLNREMDMPGFGMDEEQKVMFYRHMVPCLDLKIDERLINMYIGTTRIACDTFMHAIGMIASGSATIEDVMKKKGTDYEEQVD